MFSHLSSQRVNLQLLQQAACDELSRLLDKVDGRKLVVLDEQIMGPMNLVTTSKYFAERNITLMKLGADTKLLPVRDYPNVIFLVRPIVHLMDLLATQIFQSEKEKVVGRMFHLFFVPRRSCVCEKHLENKGVYGSLSLIEELPWNFYALDSDVLSMELPEGFKHLKTL